MFSQCWRDQESRVQERTWLMCTPRERWMPAQRMHRKRPRLTEAQDVGKAPQSAQCWLASSRVLISFTFDASSKPALGCRLATIDVILPQKRWERGLERRETLV